MHTRTHLKLQVDIGWVPQMPGGGGGGLQNEIKGTLHAAGKIGSLPL